MNTTDAYDPIMDAQEAANNYSIPDENQVISEPNEVRKKKNVGERLVDSTKTFADATGKYASAAFTPIKPFVAKQYGNIRDYGKEKMSDVKDYGVQKAAELEEYVRDTNIEATEETAKMKKKDLANKLQMSGDILYKQSKHLKSVMPTFGKTPSLSNLPGGNPNFIKPSTKTNTSLTRGGNMVVSTHGFSADDEFRIMRGVNPYIPQRNIKGSLSTTGYSGIKKIPVSPKTSFNNIQNPRGTMNFDNYSGGGIKDAIKMGAVQNSMRAQYARRNKPQKQMFVNDIVESLTDDILSGTYRVASKNTRTYQPDSLTKNKPSDITGKMGNMLKSSMRSNAVVTRKGFSTNKSNMDMNFGIGKNIGANLQNVIKSVSNKKKKTKR